VEVRPLYLDQPQCHRLHCPLLLVNKDQVLLVVGCALDTRVAVEVGLEEVGCQG
jgi:hypothetical protein